VPRLPFDPPTLELVFVRHAQPEWEPQGRACDDPVLTEYGTRQAEALPALLGATEFSGFYVSPTRRTLATARPLERHWACTATVLPWLEEIRTPHLEGTPEEEVKTFLASARSRPLKEWWDGLPGGESFRHFHQRVTTGLDAFLADTVKATPIEDLWQIDASARRYLLVAHLGTISVMISHLLRIPPVPWEWERFALSWAGACVVRANPVAGGHIWALHAFNQIHHLEHVVWT
jgi:broad specificity phosphatase PhoE